MKILKKWWFWVIIFAFIIVIPIIINECYKCDKNCYYTIWEASDVLAYWGTVLSFVGTFFLGALAFWQNEKANDLSKRLLEIEKKSKRGYFVPEHKIKIKIENQPHFIVRSHFLEKSGVSLLCCGEDNVYLSKAVCFLYGRSFENNNSIFVTTSGEFNTVSLPIELNDRERELDELDIEIVLYLENSRAYKYTQTLYLNFKKQKRNEEAYILGSFNSKFTDIDE